MRRRTFRDQDPVNIRAAELVGKLHDALFESGYRGHDLERFLVRTVFCLFADDTGIFERDIFLDFIESRTGEDGSDTGARLIELFQVLDTPESERHVTRDEDLLRFPYVNGALFDGPLRIPAFDAAMRGKLLDACNFDWSNISPAIFGALFQSVMDPAERRARGAHYTTEKNILKVIEPLFMDDLRAEFERLKARRDSRRPAELRRFQQKLGRLTFFDPACGCGNFLIIAYRELRALEMDVLKELRPRDWQSRRQAEAYAETLSLVDVDQFHGIELGEFPARIAETALWMMDHIMNNRLSLEFGQTYARIPLENSPRIVHGDALEMDWSGLLKPEDCSFVLGNPPFAGAKYQTAAQRAQVRRIAALGKTGGTLDYVAAWFVKAAEYVRGGAARIGFVATNSITQGEQVAQLWPILFQRGGLEIAFAHRTFAWGSDARGKAHVHVVILGLDRRGPRAGRETPVQLPRHRRRAGGNPPRRVVALPAGRGRIGRSASDGARGKPADQRDGQADHRFQAHRRRPLHLQRRGTRGVHGRGTPGGTVSSSLCRRARVPARRRTLDSRAARRAAGGAGADGGGARTDRRGARVPGGQQERPDPQAGGNADAVSRERHSGRAVPGHPQGQLGAARVRAGRLAGAAHDSKRSRLRPSERSLADFALLTSAMHMAWLRHVAGRLESRYRYSIGLVYNTFPTPPGFIEGTADLSGLEPLAQAVLDARAEHPGATLANLYDPDLMPAGLAPGASGR